MIDERPARCCYNVNAEHRDDNDGRQYIDGAGTGAVVCTINGNSNTSNVHIRS